MDELTTERDCEVVVETTGCFKAEDVVKVDPISRAMDVFETFQASKADIVFFEIDVFKESVGSVDAADVVTAKGFDESVLMSTVVDNSTR